jgi:hypothetical protein
MAGQCLNVRLTKTYLKFLNFEENPKMHWTNNSSWAMVQHMHDNTLEATKSIVGTT